MNPADKGPVRWEKGGERSLVKTRVLEAWGRQYRHPVRGTEREFVIIKAPDWVNVIALTADGRLVLVRQFRHGIDDFSVELPGGGVEAGEDPVEAGVRELREETGYAGKGARLLATLHPNPAILNNRTHVVLVEAAEDGGATDWDPEEEIEVVTMPVGQALAEARAGRITHSLTLAGLFHYEPLWRGAGV
jgi:8-oxo-dGTP pyrophosphatase MutT (NUDIX family)